MLLKTTFVLFVILCFWQSRSFAQQPSFRAITTEQGLPNNEVYVILQDDKGFIWIGCDAGLFRYNGIEFLAYSCTTQKSKSITGLCKAGDGNIYCYNFVGQVFCISGNEMHELKNLTASPISHIATSDNNLLWIASKSGIYYYNPRTKISVLYEAIDKKKPVLKQAPPTKIIRDAFDQMWFMEQFIGRLEKNGTFSLCNVVQEPTHIQQELLGHSLVFSYPKGTWLVSMVTNYFYRWQDGTFYYQDLPTLKKALKGKKITGVFHEKEDRIWITTFTGVMVYDFRSDEVAHILEEYAVSYFLIDRDGAYWLTTLYDGLLYIPNFHFKNWRKEPEKILKIARDEACIYFGNTKGEFNVLDTKTNQIRTHTITSVADIRSVDYDSLDKAVYFNVNNILYQFKENNIRTVYTEAGSVKAFAHLPQGYMFATSAYTHFLADFQAKENEIVNKQWGRAIAYNPVKQTVWVATNKGLMKLKQANKKWWIEDVLLPDIQILVLAYDEAKERLYAVNFEGKLYQIETSTTSAHKIVPFAYLPAGVQARAMILEKQILLIATNQGVWFLDIIQKSWENTGKLEGLISEDVHALCVLANQIWLGTSKGLQSIPFQKTTTEPRAQVFLKNVWVNQQKITSPEYLQLQYQDDVKIGVEAICYLSADKFRYAYRFKNQTNWNYLPAHTDFIHLSSLGVGKFSIEIKLLDHQNRNSINTIWLHGEVLPPFWQRLWFLVSALLVLMLVVYAIIRRSIYLVKKKQARIMKQVMLENQLKLWQQTALQTQMNPHFLFNVLNSIKTYIYENDKAKAVLYLSNFANLVRKVLHNSAKTQVSLAEEIEAITLYIDLEAMLLEENFEWHLDVPSHIDQEETYLPTFLLQPFIENAFKHGLRHQKGLKKLHITIENKPDTDTLLITIEDNGIGRKKSQIINQRAFQKHTPFATKNIEERLDVINQNQAFYLAIQIFDLENEASKPLGTKVVLNIKPQK